MPIELNFGDVRAAARPPSSDASRFRIALLGDFSGRANGGRLETGAALAKRKPIKVDADTLDKALQRLQVKLTLHLAGGAAELGIGSMDDFHPEQLYSNLELFSELSGLRQRLKTPSTFAKAAAQVQAWAGTAAAPAGPEVARGATIPLDGGLSDFADLVGKASAAGAEDSSVQDLVRQIVAPYIVPAKDPRQDALVAAVDEALSAAMRSVLHDPDFQALEALWRAVDLLVRRVETSHQLEVVLFDISAEEVAADLSGNDSLEQSGLYQLLVEQPSTDAAQGPFAVIAAHYAFARTRTHAELLGRLAKVAADAGAGCVAAIAPAVLEEDPKDIAPEIAEAWTALRALPETAYLALATPSFMLRLPYGKRSEPVDCFAFEEITAKTGLRGFLWGNPAAIVATLLGQGFAEQGKKLTPESHMAIGEMPFHYYTDKDGDQTALPCTEKLVTTAAAALAASQGFMPLVSLKGSPDMRLGSFASLIGKPLAGPWAPVVITRAAAAAVVVPQAAPEAPAEAPAPPPEAPAEAPPAEPPPGESTGDADLDALLAGFSSDAPAAAPAAEVAPEPLDAELDDLLKGL